MLTLRKAHKRDIEEMAFLGLRCWLAAYKDIYKESTIRRIVKKYYAIEKLHNDIKQKDTLYLIALENSKIAGYGMVAKGRKWELLKIYVDPNKQGKGIGSKLLQRLERFLRREGAKSYVAHPHVKNKQAIGFYENVGFKREKRFDRGWNSPCFLKRL